ncbi:hypothetical protein Pcinc_014207 [Petrolisthes cinctipes]|uniref:Uncharacterized protein n=1 Tax=Petrolisthes cinctipes TaxID=88211 RepID=A0AAE1KTG7_PETCI|nr:hypothetical protein Pcinc_014207 [Petrolisthes cinctipes]
MMEGAFVSSHYEYLRKMDLVAAVMVKVREVQGIEGVPDFASFPALSQKQMDSFLVTLLRRASRAGVYVNISYRKAPCGTLAIGSVTVDTEVFNMWW